MNDTIEQLFKNLDHQFDVETPTLGHQQRFMDKLNASKTDLKVTSNKSSYWKPLLAVAASIALILTITFNLKPDTADKDLASISPELAETQSFFASTITFELNKLNTEKSPETEQLVNDALLRLGQLEKEYKTSKIKLNRKRRRPTCYLRDDYQLSKQNRLAAKHAFTNRSDKNIKTKQL